MNVVGHSQKPNVLLQSWRSIWRRIWRRFSVKKGFDCKVWGSIRSLVGSVRFEMRQETNNEIDLLLRRLGRRQEVSVTDSDSDHLDADELSAFAENALPAAARARYTEHLADCSKCREIVVQLSGSVPIVAAKETVTVAAPSGLLKFLAGFFSPMVL